ncbi:amidase [Pseudomonas sp. DSP3-2-2]|uniref:amidase n=1 Tax=unclassified Pseudomonas TaxID=196821 RepID=UPI003CF2E492
MDNQPSTPHQFTPEEQANNARLLAALPRGSDVPIRDRIVDYEVVEMAALFREGNPDKLTSEEVLTAYLNRISSLNGPFETYANNGYYNAFVRIAGISDLLAQARQADLWLQNPNDERGPAPPLCGIPLGVKDSIGIKGLASKNGTQTFSANIAVRDATCVARLRAQGAVVVGHTICSEYSGDVIGQFAVNAWDPARAPGGSSQGSAVAPAARLIAAALGEETAGSMIIPASANGVSAIKPSLGVVSGAGVMPLRTGWDVVGPMARSVRDASLVLSLIAGSDAQNDPQTLSTPELANRLPISARSGPQPLQGLNIGIPQTDWLELNVPPSESYDTDYSNAFKQFKADLASLGANLVEFPGLDLNIEINAPYLSPYPFYDVEGEDGQLLMRVNGPVGTTYPNQFETLHWLAIRDFALSLSSEEHRDELLQVYHPDESHYVAGIIPVGIRVEAENRRRQQQVLFEKALDRDSIDFMVVMPIGAHLGLLSDPYMERIRRRRIYVEAPNALAWPMVTFPINHGQTDLPRPLPITAAFWGRRFSEPMLVQAAIDFQDRFAKYHTRAPTDPVFTGIASKAPILRFWDIPPECSNDPVGILQGRLHP